MFLSNVVNPKYCDWRANDFPPPSDFQHCHWSVFPDFFSTWFFDLLTQEVDRLTVSTKRRDLRMQESGNTARHMRTLGSADISKLSSLIPLLYGDRNLIELLSYVAGESLLIPPDVNERFVLNCLTEVGDVHGAHVDSYSYAFNVLIRGPSPDDGGVVYVCDSAAENMNQPLTALLLKPGDAYFLYSKTPHFVSALTRNDSPRILLNFAYRSVDDRAVASYSSQSLYN